MTYIELLDTLYQLVMSDHIQNKEKQDILNLIYKLERKLEKYSA